ncbi:MAG TPA: SPOR domain-containing protein [Sphingomicrobium sp.]|nr:SPOR domain-containing protein [Sphingomicrobium sp.]
MTHVHAAADGERLPWLTDDLPPPASGLAALAGWGLAVTVLVAGLSFWAGMRGPLPTWPTTAATQPDATVKLPEAAPAEPAVERPQAMPQVDPVAQPAPVVPPRAEQVQPSRDVARPGARKPRIKTATVTDAKLKAVVRKQAAPAVPKVPALHTPWESAGASGRMVRIGTYRTRGEAKKAWSRLVKVYPGMRRLRAVTTDIPSLRNGRTYYRLQFGTSSQAHSEVLCQRMRTIGQSCVVVDLAGARARNQDGEQPVGL